MLEKFFVSSFHESLEDHSLKLELVREETWTNKVDIHRIKTTNGHEINVVSPSEMLQ